MMIFGGFLIILMMTFRWIFDDGDDDLKWFCDDFDGDFRWFLMILKPMTVMKFRFCVRVRLFE